MGGWLWPGYWCTRGGQDVRGWSGAVHCCWRSRHGSARSIPVPTSATSAHGLTERSIALLMPGPSHTDGSLSVSALESTLAWSPESTPPPPPAPPPPPPRPSPHPYLPPPPPPFLPPFRLWSQRLSSFFAWIFTPSPLHIVPPSLPPVSSHLLCAFFNIK